MYPLKVICTVVLLSTISLLRAQQKTFRKFYNVGTASSLKFFDTKQALDGGYISTGIMVQNNVERPLVFKTDCNGEFVWSKFYGTTSGANNIFMKVINTPDSGFVMLNNTGGFNAFNVLVIKYDKLGNEEWKKIINNGLGSDVGNSIVQTADKGYIIAGNTNTFGSDQGSFYDDIFVAKIDSVGNWQWGKSYGRAGGYNQATKIIVTQDNGLALTGRYTEQGAFFSFLMKLDDTGSVQFLKTWGDTLHSTYGLDLLQDKKGNYLVCGSTTIAKVNFQSYSDHFLAKFNAQGDTIWTRVYYGTSQDLFESPYSICLDKNDNIILGIETSSYPSNAIVLNRQGFIKTDTNGHLMQVKTFNDRQSQYTRIYPTADNGYVVNGFTTINSTSYFRGSIFKLDSNLTTGCGETDVTNLTVETQPLFKITSPNYIVGNGGVIANYIATNSFVTTDTTLCAFTPPLSPLFSIQNLCVGDTTFFVYAGGASAISYTWTVTGINNYDTTFNTKNMAIVLPTKGNYTAKVVVTDGCIVDSFVLDFVIRDNPQVSINVSNLSPIMGDIVTLSVNNSPASYIWNTGQNTPSIQITDSGYYSVVILC